MSKSLTSLQADTHSTRFFVLLQMFSALKFVNISLRSITSQDQLRT